VKLFGRDLALYFAYLDIDYSPNGNIAWTPHYFVRTSPTTRKPQFSDNPADAKPLN
jgi:hypothetical protein